MCSVGTAHQGKSQSPVAGIACTEETKCMESIDKAIHGMVSESSGRNESERTGDLENPKTQRPSPRLGGQGSMDRGRLTDAAGHSGGALATARGQGRVKQLEKPSSSRGEICGAGNRITGITGKSVDGERVAEGPVVATKRGNARGAKRP